MLKIINIVLLYVFIVSCSAENNEYGETVESRPGYVSHPLSKNIAHSHFDASVISYYQFDQAKYSAPSGLRTLFFLLNKPELENEKKQISFVSSSAERIYVESLNEKSIVILDELNDRLVVYDLSRNVYNKLAPKGRGPGDIAFTQEMQKYGDYIYIAMQGFRISRFECQTGSCRFDETIQTNLNTYSIAPQDIGLTVLGLPPFGHGSVGEPEDEFHQFAVHRLSDAGEIIHSFSPVYQHDSPLIRDIISGDGNVRCHQPSRTCIVLYSHLPYMFLYDAESQLKRKLKLPDFIQGYYDHSERERRGYYRRDLDSSYILHSRWVDSDWLFIVTRTRRNPITGQGPPVYNQSYRYYVYDIENDKFYKIGEDSIGRTQVERVFYITEHGVVLNEDGDISWIKNLD